jgi:hypothetical protein
MKIPYGMASFALIRGEGYFYVDKTPFLPVLESGELGYRYLLFLRPRRMGKSALVSMLEHYYDLSRAGEFDALFRGLWVHDHPTPEKNSYLVLSLNFSRLGEGQGLPGLMEGFYRSVRDGVDDLLARYRGQFPELERFASQADSLTLPETLLGALMTAVRASRRRLYILIDEYDTFANALLSTGKQDLYSDVTDSSDFVRTFYRTIKVGTETGAVGRLFMTGASPILLDDLYTGFNICTNISQHARFNALAGFTRADVERAVDEVLEDQPGLAALPGIGDRAELHAVLERYYNGYRFSPEAAERVFNSDMVLYFLRELRARGMYPRQMLDMNARSDYDKPHRLWMAPGPWADERRRMLETVLREGFVWSPLIEQFGRTGPSPASQLVSLLYYTGMLTLSPEPSRGYEHRFEVPNRVIRELGWEHFAALLLELDGVDLRAHPLQAAQHAMAAGGEIAAFLEVFQETVVKALGLKDLRRLNEKALKMALLTTFVLTGVFNVLSEKEFAQGYCDLFSTPKDAAPGARFAWMLELKYLPATATAEEIEATFAQAEAQLARYTSDVDLLPAVMRGRELRAGTLLFLSNREAQFRPLPAPISPLPGRSP